MQMKKHTHGRKPFKYECQSWYCSKWMKDFKTFVKNYQRNLTPEKAEALLIKEGLLTNKGNLSPNYYSGQAIKADKERRKNGTN